MKRRDFIGVLSGAIIGWPLSSAAQFSSSRPITMIVPFPAGGGADILVRILTKYMSENLEHTIVVQNEPGAGGALAFAQVARSDPDGHTLGWTSAGFPVMATTLSNLSFNPRTDFVHICEAAENPFILVVNPQVPAKSVKELIDLAKAHPGSLNFANNGAGTLTNLVVELLMLQTGISVVQVAYRGDHFSITDLVAGQVQAMFSNSPVALPHIAAGRLRGLAVTSARRSSAAPDLPTMEEAGVPSFEVTIWQGFSAPAATPKPIVEKLNASMRQALQVPDVIERFKGLGVQRIGSTPEQFSALVAREIETWGDVVRRSGIKPN